MQGILFDLDGVLYDGGKPIVGAAEAITIVQTRGIPHRFLTNTSSRSRQNLVQRLAGFGVVTDAEHLITPTFVAAQWLREQKATNIALFVTESAAEEFQGLHILPSDTETGADYVVLGTIGEAWNFQTMNRAFRLLHANPKTVLMALGLTVYYQAEDGLRLDVAPFAVALEYATERPAVIMGKPSSTFFQTALDDIGLPANQVVMIGDDIRNDIGAAQSVGLYGIQVRTGKFRPGDLQRGTIPDAVLDSVADLPAWWDAHANSTL